MRARDERRWKVGELARATGLTVRALHHYDEVGLLIPSGRTSAGHRLYAEQDLERLYRILALRRLGMRLDEIAALLDDDGVSLLETVRRHVAQVERELERQQRLRARLGQLLDALERSIEPSTDQFIRTLEAMTVVEAKVKDVLIWQSHIDDPPPEQPLPHPPRTGQHAVLLEEHDGERVLPMWIGPAEAHALTLGLSGCTEPRPLSWDLTAQLLQAGGLRIERVVVESIRDFTFYATVVLAGDAEPQEVDARPSDAFNLAIRVGAPVFLASGLIDQAGAPAAHLPFAGTEWKAPEGMKPGAQPIGEWRSVLAEAD
jgi:bifunctional DNase/RNase/DNA-binding transcriptional MerR regulator